MKLLQTRHMMPKTIFLKVLPFKSACLNFIWFDVKNRQDKMMGPKVMECRFRYRNKQSEISKPPEAQSKAAQTSSVLLDH